MKHAPSPFKFLDSYQQEDVDIFFGREAETEQLYDALSGVKHLLVYGPSGAGKTSLIECGLRNQFSDADWYAISIRRGQDLVASTFARLHEALSEPFSLDPKTGMPADKQYSLGQAVEALFSERFQPVYLLFDQFEELLISGSEREKQDFFTRLNELIRYIVPCRVILIMREEFIGHLSEFEPLCPTLFQQRFRLEKMTRAKVQAVIQSILDADYYEAYFEVDDPKGLAIHILAKLPDDRKEIDLSHVQVFLSELWDRAIDRGGFENIPSLDQGLIRKDDKLEAVLDSFLKKQLRELATYHGKDLPLEVLAVMISERHTKLQLDAPAIRHELERRQVSLPDTLDELLHALETRRIIRRLRTGEQTQYEITHDTLALVIGKNLTEEMQLREKAEDIYRVYQEREGYFSQEDLDFIRPYRSYLPYPPELAQRITDSERYQKEEEARQLREAQAQAEKERGLAARATQRTRIALMVAGLALVAAVAAGYFFFKSESQAKESERAKEYAEAQTLVFQLNDLAPNYDERAMRLLAEKWKHLDELGVAPPPNLTREIVQPIYDQFATNTQAPRRLSDQTFQHTGEVRSAIFSPDGRLILSSSKDGTAKLWPTPRTVYEWLLSPDCPIPPLSEEERKQYNLPADE